MTYDARQVEIEWLGPNARLAYPLTQVVEALNSAETLLGPDWVLRKRGSATGTHPTLAVALGGWRAEVVAALPGHEKLLGRMRRDDASAWAEATALLLLTHDGPIDVELEDTDGAVPGVRVPDFRARVSSVADWVYGEITAPYGSSDEARVLAKMDRIRAALADLPLGSMVEVFLRREPSTTEVEQLRPEILAFGASSEPGEIELPQGLGRLFRNHQQPGLFRPDDHGEPSQPRLGSISARLEGGVRADLVVRVPFVDSRAVAILKREASQLPKDGGGLLVVDVSGSTGAWKTWGSQFRAVFRSGRHTRVSGVALLNAGISGGPDGDYWDLKAAIVPNPRATRPLPAWVTARFDNVALGPFARFGRRTSQT